MAPSDPPGLERLGFPLGDERTQNDPDTLDRPVHGTCGGYTVQQDDRHAPMTLARNGKVVFRAAPDARHSLELVLPLYCFDLTGDGEPELAYDEYTGGAHCCTVEHVLSLGAHVHHVLRWDAQDGGSLVPRQLDGTAAWELVGADMSLMEWNVPASTPSLPIVFAFEGRRYQRATRRFQDVVMAHRAMQLPALDGDSSIPFERDSYLVASSVLRGDWKQVRAELVQRHQADPPREAKAALSTLDALQRVLARTLR